MNFREHFESRLLNDVLHRMLTGKEIEVVEKISNGLTTGEVASDLGITIPTLKTHISNIRKKFNFTEDEMQNTKVMLCLFWQKYRENIKEYTLSTTSLG